LGIGKNHRVKILLVDDDVIHNKLVATRLFGRGFDVVCLEDGTNILSVIKSKNVDLVILDVFLKNSSGLDLLDLIREHYVQSALPVLMMTASSDPADVVDALGRGANDYLHKPISFLVAVARINTQISISELFRDNAQRLQKESLHEMVLTITSEIAQPTVDAIKHLQAGIATNSLESMKAAEVQMNLLAGLVRKINATTNVNSVVTSESVFDKSKTPSK
jgi:DNA-binding response OmpR family regulator